MRARSNYNGVNSKNEKMSSTHDQMVYILLIKVKCVNFNLTMSFGSRVQMCIPIVAAEITRA